MSAPCSPCHRPHRERYKPICWATWAWALVGNVIVSANAGLGLRTGSAAEAIKRATAGIRHLLEVDRTIK
jgi:hypothetical protein